MARRPALPLPRRAPGARAARVVGRIARAALAAAVAGGGAGCRVAAAPMRVDVPVPATFREAPSADGPSIADLPWAAVFRDPALPPLLREAVAENDDLAVAAARVDEARTLVGVAAAARVPHLDAEAAIDRARRAPAVGGGGGAGDTEVALRAPIAWELDVFGRVRWATTAADARARVAEEDRRDVQRIVVAEVAQAWFELRGLDEELAIARGTIATRRGTETLFRDRFAAGTGARIEVARAEAERAVAEVVVPALERQLAETENRLCVLLGRMPGPIPRPSPPQAEPPPAPAGLPIDLLERRPDLRAARASLEAAAADVGVANADRLPRLSLSALLGLEARSLADLGSADAVATSLGASLLGPVVDGGERRARAGAAWARYAQAVAVYERAVRTALREAADALVALRTFADAARAVAARATALEEAAQLAKARYDGRIAGYSEVLDAQRDLFPAQLDVVRTARARRSAVVQLYRALGGGWDVERAAPPPR